MTMNAIDSLGTAPVNTKTSGSAGHTRVAARETMIALETFELQPWVVESTAHHTHRALVMQRQLKVIDRNRFLFQRLQL